MEHLLVTAGGNFSLILFLMISLRLCTAHIALLLVEIKFIVVVFCNDYLHVHCIYINGTLLQPMIRPLLSTRNKIKDYHKILV